MTRPKYIAYVHYVDYVAWEWNFIYIDLKAKNILEAVREANKLFNEKVIMIGLCERFGKIRKNSTGVKNQVYIEVLQSVVGSNNWNAPGFTWYLNMYSDGKHGWSFQ